MAPELYEQFSDRLGRVWLAPTLAAGLLLAACSSESAPVHGAVTISAEPTQPPTEEPVPEPVAEPAPASEQASAGEGLHDPVLKDRAASVTSTFEYSTTEKQYGKAQIIDDGRGITAGWYGLTSGTSDMLYFVRFYTERHPGNALAKYQDRLQEIDKLPLGQRDTTKGLEGLIKDWESLGDDPGFRQAQDEVCDELYFNPAMERAEAAGVKTALGQLIIWDAIIQHGEGDDKDGLPEMLDEMIKANGTVQGNETEWLGKFLKIRRNHLMYSADGSTRTEWQESVGRVDALEELLRSGNLDLTDAMGWDAYGDKFRLPAIRR